jgi:Na+-transporting NADH:ubiquinone oxidoreductase subunit A
MTGEYEKVLPMKIYPVHLLKAILAEDIERMENLGIYEVAEEDFALCEYVCTSKIEVQELLRQGIELMIKEVES